MRERATLESQSGKTNDMLANIYLKITNLLHVTELYSFIPIECVFH